LVECCAAQDAEPQIANFAYGGPGATRNLVDYVRCRRFRVDDYHTLGKALAAFKAAVLPASPDSATANSAKRRLDLAEDLVAENISV
jgi:hypothetical protein